MVPAADAPPVDVPVAEPEASVATPEPAGIGTSVRDGDFEFVVQGVEAGKAEIGGEYLSTKAQGQFVLVTVQVTNIGDKPGTFFGSNAKAVDSQGRGVSASTEAAIYLEDSNSLYEEINPGNSVTGTIVFDVPTGTSLDSIQLHDSMFSDGATVKLS